MNGERGDNETLILVSVLFVNVAMIAVLLKVTKKEKESEK